MTEEKTLQKFVVGTWNEGTFTRDATQPAEPITELSKMVAWVRKTFAKAPGRYELIRVIDGGLTIYKQTTFFSKWGMPEDGDPVTEAVVPE